MQAINYCCCTLWKEYISLGGSTHPVTSQMQPPKSDVVIRPAWPHDWCYSHIEYFWHWLENWVHVSLYSLMPPDQVVSKGDRISQRVPAGTAAPQQDDFQELFKLLRCQFLVSYHTAPHNDVSLYAFHITLNSSSSMGGEKKKPFLRKLHSFSFLLMSFLKFLLFYVPFFCFIDLFLSLFII